MIDKIILYNVNNFGLFDKGYELYMLDFVNNSTYLTNLYGKFSKPISESHGEDDANAQTYSIDFKRFITQDECRYRRLHNKDTIDIISLKNNEIKTDNYYDMVKCMKRLEQKDFYNIKNERFTFIDEQEQKEYLNIVHRLLMKDKNIMLYLPKIVLLQDNSINDIIEYFSFALLDMFLFRQENVDKDLYFTFIVCNNVNNIHNSQFVITKFFDNKLNFVDIVDTHCSSNF